VKTQIIASSNGSGSFRVARSHAKHLKETIRPYLVSKKIKIFHHIKYFRCMYETFNIDKKVLIVQFIYNLRDKSFKLS
jgi:hypothetical protein